MIEIYFLTVLKAGSLRSGASMVRFLLRTLSLACRQLLSCYVLRERALMSLPLLIRAPAPMTSVNLNIFLKVPFPSIVTLGLGA